MLSGQKEQMKKWNFSRFLSKFVRFKLQIFYLIFGGLTTLVNYGSFWLLLHLYGASAALVANVVSFLAATAFAYVTNKRWVFRRTDWAFHTVLREAAAFLGARLFSFFLEEAGLFVSLTVLHADSITILGVNGVMIAKVLLSIIAVVLNYWVSRYWIFRKGHEDA